MKIALCTTENVPDAASGPRVFKSKQKRCLHVRFIEENEQIILKAFVFETRINRTVFQEA